MWWKILILTILIVWFIINMIVNIFDNMLKRMIINYLKEIRDQNPTESFVPISQIVKDINKKLKDNTEKIINIKWYVRIISRWRFNEKYIRRGCKDSPLIEESKEKKGYFGIAPRNLNVDTLFSWHDDTVYEWEMFNEKISIHKGISLGFLVWMIVIFGVFIPLWLLEYISPWLSILLAVYFVYALGSSLLDKKKWEKGVFGFDKNSLASRLGASQNQIIRDAAIATACFLYLLTSPLMPIENHFENFTNNKIPWVLLSIQNTMDALFLDISEMIGVSFSSINARTLTGRILLSVLNFSIIYSIAVMIVSAYKSQAEKRTVFSGTVKECFLFILENSMTKHKLVCVGELNRVKNKKELTTREFFLGFIEDFDKEAHEIASFHV